MSSVTYRLIDFGHGRKLEALGDFLIDRPSPAAEAARPQLADWSHANAYFDGPSKRWRTQGASGSNWTADEGSVTDRAWTVDCGRFQMPARLTPFGHLGFFPEQAANWRWLDDRQNADAESYPGKHSGPRQALNLFAYTGASTMALAGAGYRVAHVDAAKPNVVAARAAAEANGWSDRPIRYLVDDAVKFVAREIRRQRRYHTIVMDPPAYGHGPGGHAWRLQRDLWPLIDDALRLLDPAGGRLLITGHTESVNQNTVRDYLQQSGSNVRPDLDWPAARYQIGRSRLESTSGRSLDAGFSVRVEIFG